MDLAICPGDALPLPTASKTPAALESSPEGSVGRKRADPVAMFAAYARGSSLPEIAAMFDVTLSRVGTLAEKHDWAGNLANTGAIAVPVTKLEAEEQARKIQASRDVNVGLLNRLRNVADKVIGQLETDTYVLEEIKVTKDGIQRVERGPGPNDLVAIGTFVLQVVKGLQEQLGDRPELAQRNSAPSHGATQINILLPSAVAEPRELRARPASGAFGDVRTPPTVAPSSIVLPTGAK